MLKTKITAAVVQLSSGTDVAANLERAEDLVVQAAKQGAELVLLPEVFIYRGEKVLERGVAERLAGPTGERLCALAKKCGVFLLAGSIYEKAKKRRKVYNTSVWIGSDGRVLGIYRKKHLFEACVSGQTIREADIFLAGKRQAVFSAGQFSAGTGICYDVRFPEMFRVYARQGCDMIFLPSNFTYETGKDHWEILLRARAIENRCYVLAPNQYGTSSSGVRSYGNSMIVDPWGRILQRAGDNEDAVLMSVIDKKTIAEARRKIS